MKAIYSFSHCFLLVLAWCTRGTLLYFARKTFFSHIVFSISAPAFL